jgi:2-polyprenyl-3-methyl-5-hydroxy-6-metoxy-1,4-benzoquinol methylase
MRSQPFQKQKTRKEHWESMYDSRPLTEMGWYQSNPHMSLLMIGEIDKSQPVIDIGGGDGLLVDHLIDLGYSDITVLDISQKAIDRAKKRLGSRANSVQWICADIMEFRPERKYSLWHDRAVFHFFIYKTDIDKYLNTLRNSLSREGLVVVGTFSESGPSACSGLPVHQYSKELLNSRFNSGFKPVDCKEDTHITPGNMEQHYVFCSFCRS